MLVVDDSPEDAEIIADLLTSSDSPSYRLHFCNNAKDALMELRYQEYDVLLLDNHMPGYSGLWALSEMRLENISVPIVFMTGCGDERVAVQAIKLGAQDYVSKKALSTKEITDSIQYAIKRKQEDLEFLARAMRDPLTGVMARYSFDDALEQAVSRAERKGQSFALLFIDLNKFKAINDFHGHQAGDLVLIEVANRITKCLRRCDSLARLGGDEFVIILEDVGACSAQSSAVAAQRIAQEISLPYEYQGRPLTLAASIGVSIYPNSGTQKLDLVRAADQAMYECKNTPNAIFSFHETCQKIDGNVQQIRLSKSNEGAKRRRL